jgi:FHS family L-fucose permease-like MFS transporter
LVDSAVFAAYFFMALPAGFIMKKYGYKTGIIVGLVLFAIGCFLFVPAANYQSYNFFLVALFIIAIGLTILETAANPYAAALGDSATATQRLNLAQSFNGLAAAAAPVIGARIILTKGNSEEALQAMSDIERTAALAAEAASVKMPYTVLGIVLLIIAVLFALTKLPAIANSEEVGNKGKGILHALRHKHLTWAVVTQFFYVGAQVSVFSLFILYATKAAKISEVLAADYLGACGIAFLVGRFLGTFAMRYIKPQQLLALYALVNIVLSLYAIYGTGITTVYAIIGICFFMSIMFPTIFSLGIQDLKSDTAYGSSLIIMSIVGGAILPRCFGLLSDYTNNIQMGYIIPLVCFIVVLFFGMKGFKIKQI